MPGEPTPRPLTADEQPAWRALMRLMVQLPRAIDEDLLRRSGLGLTRYVVLMRLSETPGRALRMSELAEAAAISPSRMTRVVQSMITEGLLTRETVPGDGRGGLATLTDQGLQRLRDAWPFHLAGVRALVLDHLDAEDRSHLHRIAQALLDAIENTPDRSAAGCPVADPCDSGHDPR